MLIITYPCERRVLTNKLEAPQREPVAPQCNDNFISLLRKCQFLCPPLGFGFFLPELVPAHSRFEFEFQRTACERVFFAVQQCCQLDAFGIVELAWGG